MHNTNSNNLKIKLWAMRHHVHAANADMYTQRQQHNGYAILVQLTSHCTSLTADTGNHWYMSTDARLLIISAEGDSGMCMLCTDGRL